MNVYKVYVDSLEKGSVGRYVQASSAASAISKVLRASKNTQSESVSVKCQLHAKGMTHDQWKASQA